MEWTEKERLRYERARRNYLETQKRKAELSEKDKKLFEQIEAVDVRRYDVGTETVLMIAHVYQNNAINAFGTIYKLGFLKGMRKAVKESKLGGRNGKKA